MKSGHLASRALPEGTDPMMNSVKYLALTAATLASTALGSQVADAEPIHAPGRMGIGIGSGTYANGLSLKYYAAESMALQFNLGTVGGSGSDRFSDFGGIAASGDVLIENGPLLASALLNLDWNYGIGAGIASHNDNLAVAASGIVGLELNLNVLPIDLVLEYRPSLSISPDVDLEIVDFTGHLRFYFQ